MQHVRAHHGPRRGFTLIEMLVVITIIGVLVALLIPAAGRVMRRTRNAAMAIELQDMAKAIEAYKAFANDYPPDFTDRQAVINHITKAFPRNTRNIGAWYDANPTIDPAEALVIWLSMLSTNPRDPLSGTDATYSGERKVFFNFDTTRLADAAEVGLGLTKDNWAEYYPKYGKEKPYVYFDGRLIGGKYAYWSAAWPKQTVSQPPVALAATVDVVRPFRSNTLIDSVRDNSRTYPTPTFPLTNPPSNPNTTQWLEPGKFQIICAGQDNEFGVDYHLAGQTELVFKTFPVPNYDVPSTDQDNIATFSEMKTLGDSVP